MTFDQRLIETRDHPQGFVLWKISRHALPGMGITEAVLNRCQFGSGSKHDVTVFAHRLIACDKIGRALPEDAVVRFKDGNRKNLSKDNLLVLVLQEIDEDWLRRNPEVRDS